MLEITAAPESLCLLRISALGDATHAVPVVRAIQQHWPETRITWVIGKLEHKLLGGIDGIEFIVFDKGRGWRAYGDLRRAAAGRHFDILLHMQVAARANLASLALKAPIRVGWDRARSRDRHHWFVNHPVADAVQQHQVQGFLSFARALGLNATEPQWRLPVGDADRAFVTAHVEPGTPLLVISPCSSHPMRNWSPRRYAEVADHAIESLGMQVVLSGGPSSLEQQVGRAIEQRMSQPVNNLIGRDTLTQSLAMLSRAQVVISPDSGPAHIANAAGTPVIGLYACTWARRSGPYNSLHWCIDKFPDAARRFRGKPPEQLRWGSRIEQPGVMDLIQVGEVIDKLDRLAADGFEENAANSSRHTVS